MKAIIVNGAPATGKTTLVQNLLTQHDYPVLSKDEAKEKLFAAAGRTIGLREGQVYETQALKTLFDEIAKMLPTAQTVIIEGNFTPSTRRTLRKLLTGVTACELFCYAMPALAVQRFAERTTRHPSHHDEVIINVIRWENALLRLGIHRYKSVLDRRRVLRINTTDPHKIDYQEIESFISREVDKDEA